MEAYIVKAYRSAVAKANKGGFQNMRSDDLAVRVIQYLLEQTPNLDPEIVDDLIVGCANPEGEQGLQIGRMISVRALGKSVPGMTVNSKWFGDHLDSCFKDQSRPWTLLHRRRN